MRLMLHMLQSAEYVHSSIVVDDITMYTFRRGGQTHGRDRLQTKDHVMLLCASRLLFGAAATT